MLAAATMDKNPSHGVAELREAHLMVPAGDHIGLGLLNAHLCIVHLSASRIAEAANACTEGLSQAQQSDDAYAQTKAYAAQAQYYYQTGEHSNLGLITRTRGLLLESVEHFTTALEFLPQATASGRQQMVSFNIGLVYADLNEHELATDFFVPALQWAQEEGRYARELTALIYIAISDIALERAEFAQRSLESALSRPEMRVNEGYLAFAYAVLGEAFLAQERYVAALSSFETGLKIAASAPNTFEKRRLDLGYARSLAGLGRGADAIAHLEPTVKQLRFNSANHVLVETLTLLSELYTAEGDLMATVAAHRELDALNMQLQTQEFEKELAQARARYEVEEKQRELLAVERDNIIRNAAILWMLALALIGYLYLSRRATVQRSQVQAQHAVELEREVAKRTEELQVQIEEVETAEVARLGLERQLSEAEKLRVLG